MSHNKMKIAFFLLFVIGIIPNTSSELIYNHLLIKASDALKIESDSFNCPSGSDDAFILCADECRQNSSDIDVIVSCVKNCMKNKYPNNIWSVFALKQISDLHFSAQIPCIKIDTREVYGLVATAYDLCSLEQPDNLWKILGIVGIAVAGASIVALIIIIVLFKRKNKKNGLLNNQDE